MPKPTVQLGGRRHRPKAISRAPARARARFAAPLGSHPPTDKEHDPASLKFRAQHDGDPLADRLIDAIGEAFRWRRPTGGILINRSGRAGSRPGNVGRTGASLSEFGAEVSRHAVTRLVAEDHRIEPTRSAWSCRPSRVGCSQIQFGQILQQSFYACVGLE